jgi:hypothetical protein
VRLVARHPDLLPRPTTSWVNPMLGIRTLSSVEWGCWRDAGSRGTRFGIRRASRCDGLREPGGQRAPRLLVGCRPLHASFTRAWSIPIVLLKCGHDQRIRDPSLRRCSGRLVLTQCPTERQRDRNFRFFSGREIVGQAHGSRSLARQRGNLACPRPSSRRAAVPSIADPRRVRKLFAVPSGRLAQRSLPSRVETGVVRGSP